MNNNIFLKKYNPDVSEKFLEQNNNKINDINYSNQVWKGITGNEFEKNINKSEDFLINFEKPDVNRIVSKYNDEFLNREKEMKIIQEKNKLIEQASLQSTMKINIDTYIENNSLPETHDSLKRMQIAENDKLKLEKEIYNKLLEDLEDI